MTRLADGRVLVEHSVRGVACRRNASSGRGYPLNISFGPVEVRCTRFCNTDRIWTWIVPPQSGDRPPSRQEGLCGT